MRKEVIEMTSKEFERIVYKVAESGISKEDAVALVEETYKAYEKKKQATAEKDADLATVTKAFNNYIKKWYGDDADLDFKIVSKREPDVDDMFDNFFKSIGLK